MSPPVVVVLAMMGLFFSTTVLAEIRLRLLVKRLNTRLEGLGSRIQGLEIQAETPRPLKKSPVPRRRDEDGPTPLTRRRVDPPLASPIEGPSLIAIPGLAADPSVIDITVKGSFLCSQALLPGMIERKWGRIVMLGSIMSYVAIAGRSAYAAAKAGVLGLTKALALEGAPHGVTVNCLCPGPFETPMNRVLMNDPVAYQAFLAKIPLGRWGQPEELGPAIVYLCSPASAFMTGTSLTIDGGWTAQ